MKLSEDRQILILEPSVKAKIKLLCCQLKSA